MAAALSAKSTMMGTKVTIRTNRRVVAVRATPIMAAAKGGLQSIRKVPKVTTYSASFAAKKEPKAASAGSAPPLLSNIEKLKLLSTVEKSGLLTLLEKSGLTLSKIEELGLLTTAEDIGALTLLESRKTPTVISAAGASLLVAAAAEVFLIPDGEVGLIVAQVALFGVLLAGAIAAFAGSSFIAKLQE